MDQISRVSRILLLVVAVGCAAATAGGDPASRVGPATSAPAGVGGGAGWRPTGRDTTADLVDDVAAARAALRQARNVATAAGRLRPEERVRRLVRLGAWAEADSILAAAPWSPDLELAAAELALRRHRYREAEARVDSVLARSPRYREALLLRARLRIQAWDLAGAEAVAASILEESGRDVDAALLLGRVRLLQKRYDEALAWADSARRWDPSSAGAYLLEADVRFWDQDPAGAEAPLRRALALNPFDPDARFAYGYALWRRVDATLLDEMAAQWNLALEIDPLHYVTHWHFGNGHTHLTYADYAHPTDSIVRARLAAAHERIARNEIAAAIHITRALEREFPESVLPAMTRGSAFYMAYGMDLAARLDSAEATFTAILQRKPNYGPAHNGLAAVIKFRQFTYLERFDSLEAAIAATPLPDDTVFEKVFADVRLYPGDRVRRMVRTQLGPSIAYLPLLHRLELTFKLPPLHVDLAEAMGSPRLRTATTFDNRQWMDIRGIGGGAAGIEYIERGAHWERNVLVHEYMHLVHGEVLTDAENRRIRELYHAAVAAGRALDYYAANNESEFLAQAYEAYLSPVKVHPLNHKSMNTHDDLRRKDPATYAFIDSLVARQRAYLAGDTAAFRSNWAEAYVKLAESARRGRPGDGRSREERWRAAAALLDTALIWDPGYLPAHLAYAALMGEQRRFAEAERWIERAEALDPAYAPIVRARAELVAARAAAGLVPEEAAVEARAAWYRRALELERDLAERADLNRALRELYASAGRIAEAIRVAEAYVADAPTLSTYLRDRRDEAAAFAAELRAAAGDATSVLPFLAELVRRKPQHYEHRRQYAEALAVAGRYDEAVRTLEEAQRILRAAGRGRPDFMVLVAEIELMRGDTAAARRAIGPALEREDAGEAGPDRLARVLASLGLPDRAERVLAGAGGRESRAERAERAFTRGWIALRRGDAAAAERELAGALEANPYHCRARIELVRLLARAGRIEDARAAVAAAEALALPLGPDLRRAAAEALGEVGH